MKETSEPTELEKLLKSNIEIQKEINSISKWVTFFGCLTIVGIFISLIASLAYLD